MLSSKIAIVLLIACAISLGQVENKSLYGIGQRIIGDQLLVKDILQSPPTGLDESPTIGFNYAVKEQITYIEILAEENIVAEVNFSYQNDIVRGSLVVPTNYNVTVPDTFEVEIMIYGFNDTTLGVSPALLLNRDQEFEGILMPDDEEYVNSSEDGLEQFDEDEDNEHNDNGLEDDDDNEEEDNDDDTNNEEGDYDFESTDKIIDVGRRQEGDYLIYDTYQTTTASKEATNHTVIFYYIDSTYITYVKFVVFDHNVDLLAPDYNPPIAEYTHFSPSTLKATITDFNTRNLFVQMFLYGYNPADLPVDYVSFLSSGETGGDNGHGRGVITESPLYRLKAILNAQTRNIFKAEKQAEAANNIADGGAVAVSEELQVSTESNNCSGDDDQCSNAKDGAIGTIHSVSTSYLSIITSSLAANLCFAIIRWQI